MNESRRFLVSGTVQGVFFRSSAKRHAEQLGLSGYARNLVDGRVEVLAHGPTDALDELAKWLEEGPPNAQVTGVEVSAVGEQPPEGFRVL
ncbi:acylphosphatase [Alkalilimnicola ehrlichii MLHE-1]|uniref:Acylphosphatase n=1 Tax=Alkalilimnicola ehrlichii (strain ATCC BAA-1101 / DSM 17681 / MLHE-1) TaxID=187272 RepID=ACYP_ALKEH|nr:acylphosphatase [Alkalilimnicola ehrlichii]Q0ABB1.1 RecName: Full=Acylphosphatase; AltName: Full=Acylphosphate phosphohydrolase [Alkalilimnicola ehrlichii MLHE-1]ABI55876.1 acylphosphatase [Alkalilimnicola ehrlichii MLHE-1]